MRPPPPPELTEAEAKSKNGDISVTNCALVDVYGVSHPIAESLSLTGARVKMEIEGLDIDANGATVFSEYEVKGKQASGEDPRVKMEIKNGTVTIIVAPEPPVGGGGDPTGCTPPAC